MEGRPGSGERAGPLQDLLDAGETGAGDFEGILPPQRLIEDLETDPTAIAFSMEDGQFRGEVDWAVAGKDAVRVALGAGGFVRGGIVDVVVSDSLQRDGFEEFRRALAVPGVEGIDHQGSIGVAAAVENGQGVRQVVEGGEKADVFQERTDAGLPAQLEEFGISFGESFDSRPLEGWGADDEGSAESRGQFHAAPGLVEGEFVFPALGFAPVSDGDDARDLESVIRESGFDVADFACATDVFVEVDGPEFDSLEPGLGGDADFLQERSGFDGGGVQSEAHVGVNLSWRGRGCKTRERRLPAG